LPSEKGVAIHAHTYIRRYTTHTNSKNKKHSRKQKIKRQRQKGEKKKRKKENDGGRIASLLMGTEKRGY